MSRLAVLLALLAPIAACAQDPPPDVQAKIVPLFQAARQAEQARNFAAAGRMYDQILALAPTLAEVWTNKGLVLHELGRRRDALAAFTKAATLKPQLLVPHLFSGIEHLQLGEPRLAAASLNAALKLDPSHQQASYLLARAYSDLEQYPRATELFLAVIARDQRLEEAWYGLGLAWLNWSKLAARKVAGGASPYAKLVLADVQAVAGFPDPAAENYHAAIAALPPGEASALPVDPKTFQPAAGLPQKDFGTRSWKDLGGVAPSKLDDIAAAAWTTGGYNRALHALQLRLRAGDDPRALYWLSLTCRALARESLLRGIAANPESFRAHLLLADLARDRGDNQTALAEFEKAVSLEGAAAEVHLHYLQFLASVRPDSPEVLERARAAVNRFPNEPALQCELGKALLKAQAAPEAARHFQKALAIDPNLANAHAGLADAYAASGDLEKAIHEIQPALPSDSDGSLHYRLGRWYQQTGRAAQAREALAVTARLKAKRLADAEASFFARKRVQ